MLMADTRVTSDRYSSTKIVSEKLINFSFYVSRKITTLTKLYFIFSPHFCEFHKFLFSENIFQPMKN